MQRKDNNAKTKKKRLTLLLIIGFVLFSPISAITQESALPDFLDFGNIDVGESGALPFFINSVDPYSSLIVQQVFLMEDSSEYFAIFQTPEPTVLPPGESLIYDVIFTPELLGLFSGIIRVVSNDHDTPVMDVPISGSAITAAAVPEPATLILLSAGLIGLIAIRKTRH